MKPQLTLYPAHEPTHDQTDRRGCSKEESTRRGGTPGVTKKDENRAQAVLVDVAAVLVAHALVALAGRVVAALGAAAAYVRPPTLCEYGPWVTKFMVRPLPSDSTP